MCTINNEAWGNAKRGIPMTGGESGNADNLQNSFEARAYSKTEQ